MVFQVMLFGPSITTNKVDKRGTDLMKKNTFFLNNMVNAQYQQNLDRCRLLASLPVLTNNLTLKILFMFFVQQVRIQAAWVRM